MVRPFRSPDPVQSHGPAWQWPRSITVRTTEGIRQTRLFALEQAYCVGVSAARRGEFETVRACAAEALAHLGLDRPQQLPGPRGAPPWPAGVIGSMSHCPGYAITAVAWHKHLHGLGVDCEIAEPLTAIEQARVLRTDEVSAAVVQIAGPAWSRVVFSAKESLYKLWWPLCAEHLSFTDVAVTLHTDGAITFRDARDEIGGGPDDTLCINDVAGRWVLTGNRVVTVAWLTHAGHTDPASVPGILDLHAGAVDVRSGVHHRG